MTEPEPLPLSEVTRLAHAVLDQVGAVVVGKRRQLELVLAGILAGGHVLLEDYPGLAKTLADVAWRRASGCGSPGCSSPPTCCRRT